jgi:hypothetical protein
VGDVNWADPGSLRMIDGKPHHLYMRECPAGSGNRQYTWVPLVRDPVDLATLAFDEVKRRLPAPTPGFAPPSTDAVVQVGTWFWTAPGTWSPVSATAYVPGLSATVTATPTRLRFSPGDGSFGTGDVVCNGPGQAWTTADGDDAVSPCQYTYRHSSALASSGRWAASLAIDWAVRFTSSAGASRSLGSLTTTRQVPMRVGEIQAIVTKG